MFFVACERQGGLEFFQDIRAGGCRAAQEGARSRDVGRPASELFARRCRSAREISMDWTMLFFTLSSKRRVQASRPSRRWIISCRTTGERLSPVGQQSVRDFAAVLTPKSSAGGGAKFVRGVAGKNLTEQIDFRALSWKHVREVGWPPHACLAKRQYRGQSRGRGQHFFEASFGRAQFGMGLEICLGRNVAAFEGIQQMGQGGETFGPGGRRSPPTTAPAGRD